VTFEYTISTKRRALPPLQPQFPNEPVGRAPRVARLLALAHKLETMVQVGEVKDYAELAKLARVSAARIAQIVILAQLAPDIQEYILFLSAEHAGRIAESELRGIAREPRWDRQRAQFNSLLGLC
jgi:hypothetical protein